MKLVDQITALRRVYPKISIANGRQLYSEPDDLKRKAKRVAVFTLLWSMDGRVSFHQTQFEKKKPMSASEWGSWLQVNLPEVERNSILAYVNRAFGSSWNIERVFGWHLVGKRK